MASNAVVSSHHSQGPDAQNMDGVGQYLYQNKNGADITIVCGDNIIIKAHRVVICTRNQFFKGCCGLETGTDRINLTEDAETVEGILEHLYGVEVSLIEGRDIHSKYGGEYSQVKIQKNLEKLTRLYVASDKYAIRNLMNDIAGTFCYRFKAIGDSDLILHVAADVYEKTSVFDVSLRADVVNHVQVHLDIILATEETFMVLMSNTDLARDILKRAAPFLRKETEDLTSEGSSGSSDQNSPTPKKRKFDYAPRNRTI
ncbi:BTB/POZ-like protein [Lasiodiplodia theobromae]|uniref:BTB/POZ-like protein n=1 Tax=Lasiodiplodia theobromae TaxID=45133 RepID=A0A8H7ISG7_9PEZI|nr:BTB/POZ domain containing protein [Lasiodiplodia theobromae]KAF4536245.1 BTB/POZ domain containing protein [Lasiodiplodia theobromae]KAF9630867.1 BTB/POZ-like protein [Lasiodiplodia theobromae]